MIADWEKHSGSLSGSLQGNRGGLHEPWEESHYSQINKRASRPQETWGLTVV
jgi:hypothetical protein